MKLPECSPHCARSADEDKIDPRLHVWIVYAHRLAQTPPDSIPGYCVSKTPGRYESTPANREVVWFDDQPDGVRRPRLALPQDGGKITLFLNLLRLN
jgi:hypothetical protein